MRNDDRGTGGFNGLNDLVAVLSFVGNDVLRRKSCEQPLRLRTVCGLPRRQDETERIAQTIHSRMDCGGQSALRAIKGFRLVSFPLPTVCW